MTESTKTSDQPKAGPAPGVARHQYFEVYDNYGQLTRAPDFDWVNMKELATPGYLGLSPGPYEHGSGFPAFAASPKIVFQKKSTRQPLDFYRFRRIWVISDRLKAILEDFDREGFEFVRTDTLYDGGTREGLPYWFCDVIRVLDCVDEAASTITYYDRPAFESITWKSYERLLNVVMRPEAIGSAHVLRVRYYSGRVLIDEVFRNLMHAHKVSGIGFIPLDGSNRHAVR
jgi:hypothetical protein